MGEVDQTSAFITNGALESAGPMSQQFIDSLRSATKRSAALRIALAPATAIRRAFLRHKRSIKQQCYENLRDMLTEDPIMRVGDFQGAFAMDVRSDVFKRLLFTGRYETDLMQLCSKLVDPHRDAIDVGANLGFFSVLLAKAVAPHGGRVLSVEPTKNALRRLKANLQRNGVDGVATIFEGVASNQQGVVELTVIVGKEEYSCISGEKHERMMGDEGTEYVVEKQSVPSAPLDQLVAERELNPGIIKVDVEGAELLVFQGAKKTLETHRPIVLSELSERMLAKTGATTAEVVAIFKQLDYDVLDPSDLNETAPRFLDEEMLCIPRERREQYAKALASLHG